VLIPHRAAEAQGEGQGHQLQQNDSGGDGEEGDPVLVNDLNQLVHAALQMISYKLINRFVYKCRRFPFSLFTGSTRTNTPDRSLKCVLNININ